MRVEIRRYKFNYYPGHWEPTRMSRGASRVIVVLIELITSRGLLG